MGTVVLIDILKEAVLRTGCLDRVSARGRRGHPAGEVLAGRLMPAIYEYGTNNGIRAVAAGGGRGHTEDEIRYVRRRYLTRDAAQAVAIGIANATFAARRQTLVDQNYDQMIKYATAIRQGTASTEAILRRFTRSASRPTHRHDEQEMTVMCLRILQAALVYMNALMLQDVLADDDWTICSPPKTGAA